MTEHPSRAIIGATTPHRGLQPLVGRWLSEGETLATTDEPSVRIQGIDDYRWMPGGHFLLHRVDVTFGDAKVDAIEMIGFDTATGTYPMRAYDNDGVETLMTGEFRDDGTFRLTSDEQRPTIEFADDGTRMVAHWERRISGGEWTPWMEMRLTRLDDE